MKPHIGFNLICTLYPRVATLNLCPKQPTKTGGGQGQAGHSNAYPYPNMAMTALYITTPIFVPTKIPTIPTPVAGRVKSGR